MTKQEFDNTLYNLEMQTVTFNGGQFYSFREASTEIKGNTITAKSSSNSGTSGKGFTTHYYLNGKRTAKSKIYEALNG